MSDPQKQHTPTGFSLLACPCAGPYRGNTMKFLLTALTAELKESPALEREAIACTSSSTRRDGHAADPGLLDHHDQRLLGGLPRLQKGRALPQLRDAQAQLD